MMFSFSRSLPFSFMTECYDYVCEYKWMPLSVLSWLKCHIRCITKFPPLFDNEGGSLFHDFIWQTANGPLESRLLVKGYGPPNLMERGIILAEVHRNPCVIAKLPDVSLKEVCAMNISMERETQRFSIIFQILWIGKFVYQFSFLRHRIRMCASILLEKN